jgi:hypothetical protein
MDKESAAIIAEKTKEMKLKKKTKEEIQTWIDARYYRRQLPITGENLGCLTTTKKKTNIQEDYKQIELR